MSLKCGDIEIISHPTRTITEDSHHIDNLETTILPKASIQIEGHLPLPCDIRFEYDLPIKLRDGVTVFADVYRPPHAKGGSLPAILAAGPFGKNGGRNRHHFNLFPWRMGCPRQATSGLEKFEGPDPAYWCMNGYAVVHTDCRGTWKSEGNVLIGCEAEGRDNYDIIEWIAEQPWCNSKVTMAGNSYLSMTQWFTGAQRPPHLACLAPWEGWSDLYNDTVRRGGVPNPGFIDGLIRGDIASKNEGRVEDIAAMTEAYPVWNTYWEERRAKVENIECPLYVVASWTNALHTAGTFRAYRQSGSTQKWLRVHNKHEWPDLYDTRNVEDLRTFYDCFMKGINNDWMHTPKVRLSILNASGTDIINRPEAGFPLARQKPYKLYLDASTRSMSPTPPAQSFHTAYNSQSGSVSFSLTLPSQMEFTGYIRLRLWLSTTSSTDADIFAVVQKFSPQTGQLLESPVVDVGRLSPDPEGARRDLLTKHAADHSFCESYFASGPMGCLRVSHRELDEGRSSEFEPVYTHAREAMLREGEVVPVDVAIWPYGMVVGEGEELRLTVSGVNPRPHLRPNDVRPKLRNKGEHVIYTGGDKESFLLLPWIPEI